MIGLALATTLAAVAIPQNTWTVDVSNGPGTDFTDLPPAVAAAQNGDRIVVRAGAYSAITISNLAVTIEGVIGQTTIASASGAAVSVDAQPAGTTTVLSGLTLYGEPGFFCSSARVVLTDVVISTVDGPLMSGMAVLDSQVHAVRCVVRGAYDSVGFFGSFAGGAGASISSGSKLNAEQCRFFGGRGGYPGQGSGSSGGSGVVVSGEAWLTRCQVQGGDGYFDGASGVKCTGGTTRVAGAGTTISGGFGALSSGVAVEAPQGQVVVHTPAVVGATTGNVIAGPIMPSLDVFGSSLPTGVFDASAPVVIDYHGVIPNAPFFLVAGFAPDYFTAFAPMVLGPLVVDLNTATLTLGTLGNFASFSGAFVPGNHLGPLIGLPLYAQAGTFDVNAGEFRVSNGAIMRFGL